MSQYKGSIERPAAFLKSLSTLEGVQIIHSSDEQKHAVPPYLMVYPNGKVRIFSGKNDWRYWDPSIPLCSQLRIN